MGTLIPNMPCEYFSRIFLFPFPFGKPPSQICWAKYFYLDGIHTLEKHLFEFDKPPSQICWAKYFYVVGINTSAKKHTQYTTQCMTVHSNQLFIMHHEFWMKLYRVFTLLPLIALHSYPSHSPIFIPHFQYLHQCTIYITCNYWYYFFQINLYSS